jgi:hypothetical protein
MTPVILLLQLALALPAGPPQAPGKPSPAAPAASRALSLKVLLLEPLAPGGNVRLWLQITNEEQSVRLFCRAGWGYNYIPPNLQGDAWGETNTSIHGCGDDDHDGFWALLPGESRFDSFEVKSPGSPTGTLSVDVDIEEHFEGGVLAPSRKISWQGLVSDALSSGDAFRSRRVQVKN